MMRRASVILLVVSLVNLEALGQADNDPPPVKGRAAKPVADQPPRCPNHAKVLQARQPKRPAPQTKFDPFDRMAENFARNPATGFQSFIEELSDASGPALENVQVTLAEERRMGQQARAEYLARAEKQGFRVVNDEAKLRYLRDLVDTIAPHMRMRNRYAKIDITLIDCPISDGQSFPGGFLVFSTALLKEPDEATVIGVVAHELAHLDRGHLYEFAQRNKLGETGVANGSFQSFDQFFTRGMVLLSMMMRPYRPEQELEADCTAVTWLYEEGYDPRGLVGYFERLHDRLKDQPDSPLMSFWRSHPHSLDRKREVLDRLAQLQQWRPRNFLDRLPENLRKLTARNSERAKQK